MSLRKMFATAAVVGTVGVAGLVAAPAVQAAEAAPTISASAVGPTAWIPWGQYADATSCNHAGRWAVSNAGASNYTCSPNASGLWDLYIYRV
ncbi:hypothetical protein ACIQNG_21085 [Streptomyces sp. NPDC091377]|uniref:hypothetical protein n=1 Tax=unclassified Streptomyces TaxID=2593676 RepID=UPI0037F8BE58